MTHNVGYIYMRLTCNILLWWHCASDAQKDAQKKIQLLYLDTAKAEAKGTSIFHDLFVELAVKDMWRAREGLHERVRACYGVFFMCKHPRAGC